MLKLIMLEIKKVKFEYYGEETILEASFERGITLILGEVGSFKTTLLRIIGGVKEIKEGEIILNGKNIEETPPKTRNMALVSCDTVPISGKVQKALIKPLIMRGINKRDAKIQSEIVAKDFSLDLDKKIKNLSKTELVAFFHARLNLRPTEVTMFDEPYHFLAEESAVTEMIRSRQGYTLVTTCDGSDIKKLWPDYIVVIRRGKILQQGETEQVLSHPIDKYTELLLNM